MIEDGRPKRRRTSSVRPVQEVGGRVTRETDARFGPVVPSEEEEEDDEDGEGGGPFVDVGVDTW